MLHSKIEISDYNEFWLFSATFGRLQKNISYLTDNLPKQGYKVLFFPFPAANMFLLFLWFTREFNIEME